MLLHLIVFAMVDVSAWRDRVKSGHDRQSRALDLEPRRHGCREAWAAGLVFHMAHMQSSACFCLAVECNMLTVHVVWARCISS